MEPETSISDKYYIYSSDAGHEPSENVFILAPDTPINQFVASLEEKVIILDKVPTATTYTSFNPQDKWRAVFKTIDGPGIDFSLKLDPTQPSDKALLSFRFNVDAPWGPATFESSRAALESAFGKESAATLDPSAISQGEEGMTTVLHCGLIEPVNSLKPTVGQIYEYVGRGDEIKYLPSSIPSLTCTLDTSNYSGKRNALWLHPGTYSKTILQLHFKLDSTKELQKLFETDLPGLEITEADVVCKNFTLKGSTFAEGSGVFFSVRCVITFNNARVEMTAGIEINPCGVFLTMNSVPGNFDHIIAWIEDVTDLDPAALLACFGPGTIFQEFDIQGLRISLSNDITGKDDPILSSVKLNLEVASDFGKVEGKRPVFKAYTWWTDHENGDIWHQQVLGNLWSCKFLIRRTSWSMKANKCLAYDSSPGRLLHPDYKPWCDQAPYKELTTVINLEDLPGRSEPIEEGCPSQIGKVRVVMTKKYARFDVNDENNHDRIFRFSATHEWESGKSDFSLAPIQRSRYRYWDWVGR